MGKAFALKKITGQQNYIFRNAGNHLSVYEETAVTSRFTSAGLTKDMIGCKISHSLKRL